MRVQIFFSGLKGVKMPALIDLQTKKIALSNEFPTTELRAEYAKRKDLDFFVFIEEIVQL